MTPAPPAIRAEGLSKRYSVGWLPSWLPGSQAGRALALDGVSIEVPAGRVVGILGPNGAGKTTFLKCLLGLLRPSSGHAEVLGAPAGDAPTRRRIGALIGAPALVGDFSGRKNLTFSARFHEGGPAQVGALLEKVGLAQAADRPARAYSTGMKQRLGLAASLLGDPELWVLDEPSRGLDPRGRAEIRGLVREAAAAPTRTVLFSSHDLHEVEQVCDYVAVLAAGKLVAAGPVAELLGEDRGEVALRCGDPEKARPLLEALPGCRGVREEAGEEGGLTLVLSGPPGLAPAAAAALVGAGIPLHALEPRRRDLEDYFLEMVEEAPCS